MQAIIAEQRKELEFLKSQNKGASETQRNKQLSDSDKSSAERKSSNDKKYVSCNIIIF